LLPPASFFVKMGNLSSKHGKESQPPPYESVMPPTSRDKSRTNKSYNIRATDTPQWLWNEEQCRLWLTAVLVEYGCKERDIAEGMAAKFEGFGPSMYLRTRDGWCKLFGNYGGAIYSLLLGKRHHKGAVPKGSSLLL